MRSIHLRSADAPRSPRIFKKRVRRADDGIRPGEVVAVRTSEGAFVGRAIYSPRSVIAARILDREENGPPIDGAWFERRIAAAARLRREVLGLDRVADAYRVVHAEGDGLPALIIDRYGEIAVIEVGARGVFEHLDEIEQAVESILGSKRVVVRADAEVEKIEGFRATDRRAAPAETIVREHDLRYHVDCTGGHKTGFFVDQREARRMVFDLARGRRVLDLCCYSGGFALSAALGGARSVTAVDLDEEAIEMAQRNARLNGQTVRLVHADAFDFLREGAHGDLVVLDPPKLASTPRQLDAARRKSVDLNALAFEAVEPGGLLFTFSCTGLFAPLEFTHQVKDAARRAGRSVRVLRETGQPPDHPVAFDCPEGRYLSGLLLQVE
jgi:23S rRNA (cytosine1962-C5)-methyltransferase